MTPNLAFITCIEAGSLEAQALLLYESIRRYGGRFSNCPVYAFAPRAGYDVSPETKKRLDKLGIEYIDLVLNDEFTYYPQGNKNFAAAYVENQKKHDFLVFLDSDTLFLREPGELELPDNCDVAVRPVSWKTICTSGAADDLNDNYWHLLCNCCKVDYNTIPFVKTFVEGSIIKACYNAGLVAVRASKGVFSKWQDDFVTVLRKGLKTKKGGVWGTDQTTLTTAIWGATDKVQILEPVYNYPIRENGARKAQIEFTSSRPLIHIHYHHMFNHENLAANPLFQTNFDLEPEFKTWLSERLPLD